MTSKTTTEREKARRSAMLDRALKNLQLFVQLEPKEQRVMAQYMRRIIAARKAQAK